MFDQPLLPLPSNAQELARCLADPEWRLFSGCLYKIMVKGDDDDDATVLPFQPNHAQRRFVTRLWHRNLILKARQLGFTTLIAIRWLDHALFNANQRCGIIAQDREAAEAIFRDKVKFGYENLPAQIRERFPLERDSASELLFAYNNSSVRVATSMRSGTIHRLHVSEFGKICAKFPDKALEVVTGSIADSLHFGWVAPGPNFTGLRPARPLACVTSAGPGAFVRPDPGRLASSFGRLGGGNAPSPSSK